MNNIKKISPWAWVPTLYFAQGIPYFIVNNISVLMFATTGSLLWYQGMKINANMNILREQKESLEKLNAKTWGVEFVQDGNRKFLVLPYGKSAEVIPFQGKEWVHLKE